MNLNFLSDTHPDSEYQRSMLDNDTMEDFLHTEILNVAFIAGSSKQGNALLASTGEKCVAASMLGTEKATFDDSHCAKETLSTE